MANVLSPARRAQIERLLRSGVGLMETVRLSGAAKETVARVAREEKIDTSRSEGMKAHHARRHADDELPGLIKLLSAQPEGKRVSDGNEWWVSDGLVWRAATDTEEFCTISGLATKLRALGFTAEDVADKITDTPPYTEKPLAPAKRIEQGQPKRCNKCGGTEPETYFYPSQKSLCKECQSNMARRRAREISEMYVAPEKRRPRYEIDDEGRKLDAKPPLLAPFEHEVEPEPIAETTIACEATLQPAIRSLRTTDPQPLTVYESCLKIFSEMPLPAGINDALEMVMELQRKEWQERPPLPELPEPVKFFNDAPVGLNRAEFWRYAYTWLHKAVTRRPIYDGDWGFEYLHGTVKVEVEVDKGGFGWVSIDAEHPHPEKPTPEYMRQLAQDMADMFPLYVWIEQISIMASTLEGAP